MLFGLGGSLVTGILAIGIFFKYLIVKKSFNNLKFAIVKKDALFKKVSDNNSVRQMVRLNNYQPH